MDNNINNNDNTSNVEEQKPSNDISTKPKKLLGAWECFGSILLMLLPIIGFIIAIIWSVTPSVNPQRRKLAQAMLLMFVLMLIVLTVLAVAAGMFISSMLEKYDQLDSAQLYIEAFFNDGVDGVIDVMYKNGDLEKIIDSIDIDELMQKVDMNALLAEVDPQVLIDNIDMDKLMQEIDMEVIIDNIDTEQLINEIGAEKLSEYIDFESLLEQVDEETLQQWANMFAIYTGVEVSTN